MNKIWIKELDLISVCIYIISNEMSPIKDKIIPEITPFMKCKSRLWVLSLSQIKFKEMPKMNKPEIQNRGTKWNFETSPIIEKYIMIFFFLIDERI